MQKACDVQRDTLYSLMVDVMMHFVESVIAVVNKFNSYLVLPFSFSEVIILSFLIYVNIILVSPRVLQS